MEKILIAAVSKNNVIANKGKIPWHSKEDLLHFKKTTSGFPVIMGRKTFETLNVPLSDRLNIVVTRNKSYRLNPNVIICYSLKEAIDLCRNDGFDKVFIIGGGEIFNQIIDDSDQIILSQMDVKVEGDTFFPKFDLNLWEEKSIEKFTDFTVHYYIRRQV